MDILNTSIKRYCIRLALLFFLSFSQGLSYVAAPVDSLDIQIGQMICVGLGELRAMTGREPILRAILEQKVGAVILYEKNLSEKQSALRLRKLIATLQIAAQTPLWIAIDEEGGQVNRLKPRYGFIATLSATTLGKKDPLHTANQSQRIAQQLNQLGINLNFAPVVDLAIHPENTVIVQAERSFGTDPEQVAAHAAAFIKAHHKEGVTTVLKHFPGHGSSTQDTHVGTADVSKGWKIEEIYPYRKLIEMNIVSAIMSAHIVNERLDPEKHPATLSRPIIEGLLRNVLGYRGLVFSDDLHMQAITDHYGIEEAILRAINAGVDVLLFSQNIPQSEQKDPSQLHSLIRELVEDGKISRARIKESYHRIISLKQKTLTQKDH